MSQPVNKWMIAIAVSVGALLEIIDTTIVNVALTDMQATLGATLSGIGWVVSSYAVANVIILPLSAWLGDRFGKKNYWVFSLIGFVAASVLCGLSTNLPMLIVARVIQGLTGGGLLAKGMAILFETFPPAEQAMAQALFAAVVIAGPAIGPTLGGWITTNFSWRWIFFVNVPVGVVAVIMSQRYLPADEKRTGAKEAIDWLSLALLVAGLGALQTVLEQGQEDDWFESPFITALAVLAVVGLLTFIMRQVRAKNPVVDLRVLRYRSVWAGSLISVAMGIMLYGALFAIPIFASSFMGYTSQQIGFLLLPSAIAAALANPLVAKLMPKLDPRLLLLAGALMVAGALFPLSHLAPTSSEPDLFWPLIVRGFGVPFMFLPLSLATLGPLPKKDVPAASGFFNLTRQLGGSIGVAMLTTLVARRSAFHRNVIVEKLPAVSSAVSDRLAAYTAKFLGDGYSLVDAKQKALALLDGNVNVQAAVMSFGDSFWAVALIIVLAIPLILLLGKPATGAKMEMAH